MPPLLVISLIAALILLSLSAAWLALRTRRTARRVRKPQKRTPAVAPTAAPGRAAFALNRDEANELLQNARDMARADPARAAQTMRRWLSDSEH